MVKMSSLVYRHHHHPNPDHEFVLRGEKSLATRTTLSINIPERNPAQYPYRYRYGSHRYTKSKQIPGYVKNSMLTHSTQNLSQHRYHPDAYQDGSGLGGSLRDLSQSLTKVSGNLRRSLLMEDRDNVRPHTSTHYHSQSELNEALTDALNDYVPPRDLLSRTSWYTKPIHLTSEVRIPMKSEEMLASRFFPVTLGESKSLELMNSIKPAKQKTKRVRSKSAKRETSSNLRGDARRVDNLYLMTADNPYIKTADITFTSPYNEELAKLRMEKLRIEEKQYLELKRQAELERIRGPKPKWYELRSPEFHYEAKKNNDLLKNSQKWDELLKYRENLLDATTRLRLALDNYTVPVY